MVISPSVASSDVLRVADEVRFIDRNFSHIHLDIEDGTYVPNITFGFKMAKGVCRMSHCHKSLHLMVNDPLRWVEDVRACEADIVFLHVEHTPDPMGVLDAYRSRGIPVGLAMSNRDLGQDRDALLQSVEQVLVLTAVIEDPNQAFDPALGRMAAELAACPNRKVWIDGGLGPAQLSQMEQAGVYGAVLGRAVFAHREEAARLYGTGGV